MTDELQPNQESIATIYAEKIRPLRTRSCSLDIPRRENDARIFHTLLGIELKVGRTRFACPDLATARYMKVFARMGCRDFAIPYDITRISTLADDLETAWQRIMLTHKADSSSLTDRERRQRRSSLIRTIRNEIEEIGPGEKMPEFKQSTKQREA